MHLLLYVPILYHHEAIDSQRHHAFSIHGDKCIAEKFPESFAFEFRPRTLQNMWTKYSGLKLSLYEATRHSFCTQIVETGVNTLQAKELMRHADIRSTEKYFHASITKLRDVIEKRGKVIPFIPSEILPMKAGKP